MCPLPEASHTALWSPKPKTERGRPRGTTVSVTESFASRPFEAFSAYAMSVTTNGGGGGSRRSRRPWLEIVVGQRCFLTSCDARMSSLRITSRLSSVSSIESHR